jgi:DNA-binding transcriptional MerR regulator
MDGWTVGQLAAETGVSVRALHHYDALGLLTPSRRTAAGYRLYGDAEVERLYRIRALQSLGLSLDEVAQVLDGLPLRAVLAQQLEHVEKTLAQLRRLRGRLQRLSAESTVAGLIETMEAFEMHERYFTQEQLDAIASRSDRAEEGQRAWAALMGEVKEMHAAGADPRGPEMQVLAGRWRALIDEFTGGDPGILEALKRMYENEGAAAARQDAFSPELAAFMNEALRPS